MEVIIFLLCIESVIASAEDHNPKWKLNKANWEQFHSLCNIVLDIEHFDKSTDLVADFTSSFTDFTSSRTDISNRCIPKTSTNPKKSNPWYNDDCKNDIRQNDIRQR